MAHTTFRLAPLLPPITSSGNALAVEVTSPPDSAIRTRFSFLFLPQRVCEWPRLRRHSVPSRCSTRQVAIVTKSPAPLNLTLVVVFCSAECCASAEHGHWSAGRWHCECECRTTVHLHRLPQGKETSLLVSRRTLRILTLFAALPSRAGSVWQHAAERCSAGQHACHGERERRQLR